MPSRSSKTTKPKIGLYVDDSNLFYQQKNAGWKINYGRLITYLSQYGEVIVAKYFMGTPNWEPSKSISLAIEKYISAEGYTVIKKPVKRILDSTKPSGYRHKCNFDVEIASEIDDDLEKLDKVYIASGDSDFVCLKDKVIKKGKRIEYLAFKNGCAWEIRVFHHTFLDDIQSQIERRQ